MSLKQVKTFSAASKFGRIDADLTLVDNAIEQSRDFLLSQQHPEGFWCGELEADSMLEADYIFLHMLLESGDPGRLRRALTEMFRYQNEDGSWSIYPNGPGEVKCSSFHQVLLRCEADGRWRRRSSPGYVPRVDPGTRWR